MSASFAWLRRLARVPNRRGQVWMHSDSCTETVVVLGDPTLANPYLARTFNSSTFDRVFSAVANVIAAGAPVGWCHDVFCLVKNERFLLNECFFTESEKELGSAQYRRLA